jgi:hypothetical protein
MNGPTRCPSWAECRNRLSRFTVYTTAVRCGCGRGTPRPPGRPRWPARSGDTALTGELPDILKRSSKQARRQSSKLASAGQVYGEGGQALRAAYAEFKRAFEKRGDHWTRSRPLRLRASARVSWRRIPKTVPVPGLTIPALRKRG